jgi:hypothetical protein
MPPHEMTGMDSPVLPNRLYCMLPFIALFTVGRNMGLQGGSVGW